MNATGSYFRQHDKFWQFDNCSYVFKRFLSLFVKVVGFFFPSSFSQTILAVHTLYSGCHWLNNDPSRWACLNLQNLEICYMAKETLQVWLRILRGRDYPRRPNDIITNVLIRGKEGEILSWSKGNVTKTVIGMLSRSWKRQEPPEGTSPGFRFWSPEL